jgi:DNA-binding winged helix-turn-helix (wHTH) protein/tetratricopeptide (TPR) repeat protein
MANRSILKFGPFEVDPSQRELRKHGARVPMQEKPLLLLIAVIERRGELVSRSELQQHLWKNEAFGDFDTGLNTAVRKVRIALGDESDSPRYLETIPRRGYRFLAPVEIVNASGSASHLVAESESTLSPNMPTRKLIRAALMAAVIIIVGSALTMWLLASRPVFSFNSRDSVLITDFENQTGDPRFDHALETAFTVSMAQSPRVNIFPRARLASVLALMGKPATETITPSVGREICQRENIRGLIGLSVTRMGDEYALSAELVDPQTGEAVRSYTQRSYGEGHILDALDVIAADLRRDLGESLYQIHKNTRPLPEVTTASLAALQEYADGSVLWQKGKYQDGVTLLRAATETDPDFAMAHAALGNAYYSYIFNEATKGDQEYQKALTLISRTTARERMNIQANYANNRGHVAEAEQLFQIYLQRYPEDWGMLSGYARLLRRNGHAELAIEQYKQLLRLAPDDAKTHGELATAYSSLGRFQDAVDAYAQAFKIDPAFPNTGNVSREYSMALIETGQVPKAEALFNAQLADQKTREPGLRSLALLSMLYGKYASARQLLEQASALDTIAAAPVSLAREHLQLAILAAGEENTREARDQLNAAIDNLKTVDAKVPLGAWIGSECARNGLIKQAEAIQADIAPRVDTNSQEQVAYREFLQGEIALQQGDHAKAIQLLTSAEQQNSSAFSMEALARAYQMSGDNAKAIAQYEKFLAAPQHALLWEPQQRWLMAHLVLASDYVAIGDRTNAKRTLAPLLNLLKDADPSLPLRRDAFALEAQIKN